MFVWASLCIYRCHRDQRPWIPGLELEAPVSLQSRFCKPNSHLLEQCFSVFLMLQSFNTFPQVVVTLNHDSNVATVMDPNVNNSGNRVLPKELPTTS